VIGQFSGHRSPGVQGNPVDQDKYWLPEIERVLTREQRTSELMQGAIWILHAYSGVEIPSPELAVVPGLTGGKDGEWSHESVDTIGKSFRTHRGLQLKLATEATSLFPKSPSAWQTRAAVNCEFYDPEYESPTALNWRNVLDECQSHDPGNALYEYLAADRLLQEADQLEFAEELDASRGISQSEEIKAERRKNALNLETSAVEHIRRGLGMQRLEVPDERAPRRQGRDQRLDRPRP
jgi:hypothetical protein